MQMEEENVDGPITKSFEELGLGLGLGAREVDVDLDGQDPLDVTHHGPPAQPPPLTRTLPEGFALLQTGGAAEVDTDAASNSSSSSGKGSHHSSLSEVSA